MVETHFLDSISIGALFVLSILLMISMLELGLRFGRRKEAKQSKAQIAQVRALMGATLGLLAFMLAFTFSGSQQHFENRAQLQIDEAVLAKHAFLQADFLDAVERDYARQLLLEYVEDRVDVIDAVKSRQGHKVLATLARGTELQQQLWVLGVDSTAAGANSFAMSVQGLIEMQTRRVNAALVNRIPLIIWLSLFFTASVAMLVTGYQAGLTAARSPLATYSLAVAFSAVMMLTMDLDRPLQSLFEIDVTVMQQLADYMRASMA